MKALIFLGSPRGKQSSSYHVAEHFIGGLKKAGCRTEEILVRDMKINPCRGCFTCWIKTPGRCVHRDDMDTILAKIEAADLVVYAFPLYIYSMPGIVKNLLDRQIPLFKPELVEKNGITGHPPRNPNRKQKVFLISVAGFPERTHFAALVSTFEKCFRSENNKFSGSILIGGAEPMHLEEMQSAYADLYKLVEKAGHETGKSGAISEKTNRAIIELTTYNKETSAEFREMGNNYWKSFEPLKNKTLEIDTQARELKLNSGGIKTFLAGMALQYKPSAMPDFEGSIQFKLDNASYFLAIKNAACKAYAGQISNPITTITTTAEAWVDIATGKCSGQQAVMDGKMKVDGELGLLMKMGELFGGNRSQKQNSGTDGKDKTAAIPEHRGPIKIPGMLWLNIIFIPWIFKWIFGSFTTGTAPFIGAAALALVIFLYHLFTNRPTLFETGSMIYLTLSLVLKITAVELFIKNTFFFDNLFLSGLWLGSLMTAFTLTGEYSRYMLPKALWGSPALIKTNQIICGVWGLYFMLCAVFGFVLLNGVWTEIYWRVLSYILLAPMFVFTSIFQIWYPKRLMTQDVVS